MRMNQFLFDGLLHLFDNNRGHLRHILDLVDISNGGAHGKPGVGFSAERKIRLLLVDTETDLELKLKGGLIKLWISSNHLDRAMGNKPTSTFKLQTKSL